MPSLELAVHGLGVAAVRVELLVGESGLGYLLKVFGSVEIAFAVAWSLRAGGRIRCHAVTFHQYGVQDFQSARNPAR
jgi:hypothetical protein